LCENHLILRQVSAPCPLQTSLDLASQDGDYDVLPSYRKVNFSVTA
jgi:hypothetical protein